MPVHHVDRALEALAHRERMRGLGKVGVVDDNGVDIVAGDKSAVPAEILVSCAGAEVVALLDGQKFVLSVALHVAELRRADGHGDDLVHRQQRAACDIRPERDEVALAQQRPHGRDARADVDIRPRAVRRDDAMLAHGLALALVGVDAVRHDGMVLPQPRAVVALPILRAVGAELFDPRDLTLIFGQVRLDVQPALRGELAEPAHQLVGARWGEARRQDGLDGLEAPARIQPAQRFALGLLGRLLKLGAAVAVHVDLADIARDARLFELFHQNERRVRVEGGKHANARRAARDEVARELFVNAAGVVAVFKARLGLERVGVEPVDQRQIHAHAEHGVLRRVQVHVDKRRHDEAITVVDDFRVGVLRHGLFNALDAAVVMQDEAAVLDDLELAERRCGNEIALEDLHISHSCFSFVQKKKRPARGLLPRLSTHSRAFRRLRRNFRAM